jgi:hypothetical protein
MTKTPTEKTKDQLAHFLFNDLCSRLVTGIGIGLNPPADALPGAPANVPAEEILVFVEPAAECELQALQAAIEHEAKGVAVLLLPVGRFVGLQTIPGDSLSLLAPGRYNLPRVSAGTFGAVVKAGGEDYILGCNHVMAHNGRAPLGTWIVAPGTLDDSHGNEIGVLSHFVDLKPLPWPEPPQRRVLPLPAQPLPSTWVNQVDCALAQVTDPNAIGPAPVQVEPFGGIWKGGEAVQKYGRTTGHTQSQIRIRACETFVDLAFGTYFFENQVAVIGRTGGGTLNPLEAFAAPGDSGSAVTTVMPTGSGDGVGLVTARAYSSGVYGSVFPGKYHGYIVLMCPLGEVRRQLAAELGVQPDQLKIFRG